LKSKSRRSPGPEFVDDPGFAEALFGLEAPRLSHQRQAQRKTQQLCRQVQRALTLAFADRAALEPLSGLFVEDVSPAPGGGPLLVHLGLPDARPLDAVLAALQRETPRLRAEVAAAITRKRAPELLFVPAVPFGGEDE